jgi:hypothetical protein
MNLKKEEISGEVKLLLDRISELAKENAITPNYERILKYLQEISIIDFNDNEKRTRKAKYLLNKQIYDEAMEKNGPHPLVNTPEFMDKMNAIWDFSKAGQISVIPYHKGKTD